MNQKISMNQTGILIAFTILANKILLLPSLMYGETKADSIFVLIALFVLDFTALPVFIKLKSKFPDKKLTEILSAFLTKYIARFIFILLLFYMLFKAILTFSIVYDYFKQQIYQDEFFWIAIICIVPVMNHAVLNGIRPTARTMELFFSIVFVGILICFFISFFTPISMPFFFVSNVSQIFSGVHKYVFFFGDFLLLFVLLDKIDFKKEQQKKLYFYALFAMAIVVILFLIYYSKYQITAFMHNTALSDILVFSVQFNAIGRLDIIAMITIMTLATFQMEIFCIGFCESFVNIFPLLNKKWAVVIFDLAFFLMYYLYLGKFEVMIRTSVSWLTILGTVVSYVLPLIFLLAVFLRRKNE